eukprot:scaffold13.g369.t1
MDHVRELFQKPEGHAKEHKDKLAATKQNEREIKEALKAVKEQEKAKREAEEREHARLLKEERQLHDTHRAHKDARDAAKREHHKETGQVSRGGGRRGMCEHGVWRCKICFPHKDKRTH